MIRPRGLGVVMGVHIYKAGRDYAPACINFGRRARFHFANGGNGTTCDRDICLERLASSTVNNGTSAYN